MPSLISQQAGTEYLQQCAEFLCSAIAPLVRSPWGSVPLASLNATQMRMDPPKNRWSHVNDFLLAPQCRSLCAPQDERTAPLTQLQGRDSAVRQSLNLIRRAKAR